jgi:hypothetical protein
MESGASEGKEAEVGDDTLGVSYEPTKFSCANDGDKLTPTSYNTAEFLRDEDPPEEDNADDYHLTEGNS